MKWVTFVLLVNADLLDLQKTFKYKSKGRWNFNERFKAKREIILRERVTGLEEGLQVC